MPASVDINYEYVDPVPAPLPHVGLITRVAIVSTGMPSKILVFRALKQALPGDDLEYSFERVASLIDMTLPEEDADIDQGQPLMRTDVAEFYHQTMEERDQLKDDLARAIKQLVDSYNGEVTTETVTIT